MRKTFSLLAAMAMVCTLVTGCANTEKKLGRGITNVGEIVRWGEFRRSVEQNALFNGADSGHATGAITGFNRTIARTGIGVFEVVTCPLPPYDPVCTGYLSPTPAQPDNFSPELVEDSLFATDTNLGFGGGAIAPVVPGCRFRIFDTH